MHALILLIGCYLLVNVDYAFLGVEILPDSLGYLFIAILLTPLAATSRHLVWACRFAGVAVAVSLADVFDHVPSGEPVWRSIYTSQIALSTLLDLIVTWLIIVALSRKAAIQKLTWYSPHAILTLVLYLGLGAAAGGVKIYAEFNTETANDMAIAHLVLGASQFLVIAALLFHASRRVDVMLPDLEPEPEEDAQVVRVAKSSSRKQLAARQRFSRPPSVALASARRSRARAAAKAAQIATHAPAEAGAEPAAADPQNGSAPPQPDASAGDAPAAAAPVEVPSPNAVDVVPGGEEPPPLPPDAPAQPEPPKA